jgi:putative transcriptional regulator
MAVPSLADPNFRYSVTCISEHTTEGALGIVVNHVHAGIDLKMIFKELEITFVSDVAAVPVYVGGPVHSHELFVLHARPLLEYGGILINEALALSNSRAILEAIAAGKGPQDYIIALGCAGWGPGQLEWELSQNAWLTGACSHEILFHTPVEARWERAIQQLGIDPTLLSDTVGHA